MTSPNDTDALIKELDTPDPLDSAEYDLHGLEEAISAVERRLLAPNGREELGREIVWLTELDARLHDIAFLLRPRAAA